MNIISNTCLGGYIYKNLLNEEYKNPFIWTLFENPNDYIDLIKNWKSVNFDNFELTKKGKELKNNFQIIIDEKYPVSYVHVFFDKNENKTKFYEWMPRIVGENIYTSKPWEYIVEKYISRLERMKKENKTIFFYSDSNLDCSKLKELPQIFMENKFNGIIFTYDKTIKSNKFTKVFYTSKDDSPTKICKLYQKEILEFINENRNNNDQLD